jgi:hypothetical protein
MKMLKILTLTIISFLGFIICIQSQPIIRFQAGINVAGLRGHKTYDENRPRFGLSGYLFADVPLGRNSIVSLETGLCYSPQGSNHMVTTLDVASTNELHIHNKLNYLVIPVYLKENYSDFYTKIGPYAAYLISAESKWNNIESKSNVVVEETSGTYDKFKENASKYDLGLSFGFGFVHYFDPTIYRNKRHRNKRTPVMQVDFKYNMGFTTIDATGNIPEMALKNHVFTIGLSFTSVNN